jgi:hypothetical protein
MPTFGEARTIQDKVKGDGAGEVVSDVTSLAQSWLLSVGASITEAPTYWSRARDEWLSNFWRRPGNDLLAGALATLNAKITAAGWYIEGPLTIAMMARNMLLYQSEYYDGWDAMVQKWAMSYLDRDFGGTIEQFRASASDHSGPALGYAHIDESKLKRTTNPEYPYTYQTEKGPIKVHRSQIARIVDSSSPKDKDRGTGFCAVSRAIATSLVLLDIVRYKRERLSDLPPAGLLILNNYTQTQWEDIMSVYDARQRQQGNITWRDLMTICGVDPRYPITAEMFAFSELPEHYDERAATEIAVYTFALALRMDPRELWPVSAGPLGTATEAEIQHRKAKAKGEGIIFAAIERQLNGPNALPGTVKFRFDFRDDEDDERAATINYQKLRNIRSMWESSPNRGDGEGIITTEEARKWAVREGLVPADIVGEALTEGKVYDIRAYGPPARVYHDGRVLAA